MLIQKLRQGEPCFIKTGVERWFPEKKPKHYCTYAGWRRIAADAIQESDTIDMVAPEAYNFIVRNLRSVAASGEAVPEIFDMHRAVWQRGGNK